MQRVVSDSDVIIHLAKLDELNLIRELYGCVYIPAYVESEIVRYQYEEAWLVEEAVRQGILKVVETDDGNARNLAKRYGIHIGEGHVKELAERLSAKIFLSNERKVRIAANKEGFSAVGTIGIILRSVTENLLTVEKALELLEKLRENEFRIHPNIINHAADSLKKGLKN